MKRLSILAGLLALTAACSQGGDVNNAAAASAPGPGNEAAEVRPDVLPNAPTAWATTPSGLRYRRTRGDGSGRKPSPSDTVILHYVGTLEDGTEFDSSISQGGPVSLNLATLIPAWQEGVPMMGVGDVYEFVVPPELGYGPRAAGPIPPNSTLYFTIGLLGIQS